MKKAYILLAAIICLSSCSTYKYSARSVSVDNRNIIASPTVVDVDVDYSRRITETSRRCRTQSEAIQEAQYKAITGNQIDILVDMICKVEKRGGRFTATVTGFAGHYKNSRTLYDDIRQMKEIGKEDVKNILVLRNAFEKTRTQMKVNTLSINTLSDNLSFQMFAELTLKKT